MPLLESDAIILKTYPLGEADRIVAFLQPRARKGPRSRQRRAQDEESIWRRRWNLWLHSRIQFFEKENRDLVRIQSAEILDSPMALFTDYDRAVFAGHLVDLTDRFLPEHQPHDAVFRLVRMMVQAVERRLPARYCGLLLRSLDAAPCRSISRPVSLFGLSKPLESG